VPQVAPVGPAGSGWQIELVQMPEQHWLLPEQAWSVSLQTVDEQVPSALQICEQHRCGSDCEHASPGSSQRLSEALQFPASQLPTPPQHSASVAQLPVSLQVIVGSTHRFPAPQRPEQQSPEGPGVVHASPVAEHAVLTQTLVPTWPSHLFVQQSPGTVQEPPG